VKEGVGSGEEARKEEEGEERGESVKLERERVETKRGVVRTREG